MKTKRDFLLLRRKTNEEEERECEKREGVWERAKGVFAGRFGVFFDASFSNEEEDEEEKREVNISTTTTTRTKTNRTFHLSQKKRRQLLISRSARVCK